MQWAAWSGVVFMFRAVQESCIEVEVYCLHYGLACCANAENTLSMFTIRQPNDGE